MLVIWRSITKDFLIDDVSADIFGNVWLDFPSNSSSLLKDANVIRLLD